MKNGTVHIDSWLLSIFHETSAMKKPNLINMLTHKGGFVEDEKVCDEKGPALLAFFKILLPFS